jgi:hypothetical protein
VLSAAIFRWLHHPEHVHHADAEPDTVAITDAKSDSIADP